MQQAAMNSGELVCLTTWDHFTRWSRGLEHSSWVTATGNWTSIRSVKSALKVKCCISSAVHTSGLYALPLTHRETSSSGLSQASYPAAGRSASATSRHYGRTSAELQAAGTSLLLGTVRTTAGRVERHCCGVWCTPAINKLLVVLAFGFLLWFPSWRHQLPASAVTRAAWRGRGQWQRQSSTRRRAEYGYQLKSTAPYIPTHTRILWTPSSFTSVHFSRILGTNWHA